MKNFAYGISILFHPLFMSAYFLLFIYLLNPYFIEGSEKQSTLLVIQLLASTILFPMIATFMMKGLGFIDSLDMSDHKERVGPLLITSIFYIWMFLNFKRSSFVPEYITYFLLGSTISLFASFFVTLFYKISLHAVAISGLITGLYLVKTKYFFYEFVLPVINLNFVISADVLIMFLVLIMGLIGTSRLYLNQHTKKQIYIGYFTGFAAMIAGFFFYF
jgi:hypothetical protein